MVRDIRRHMLWYDADSCLWNRREEAYEAPELDNHREFSSIVPVGHA